MNKGAVYGGVPLTAPLRFGRNVQEISTSFWWGGWSVGMCSVSSRSLRNVKEWAYGIGYVFFV